MACGSRYHTQSFAARLCHRCLQLIQGLRPFRQFLQVSALRLYAPRTQKFFFRVRCRAVHGSLTPPVTPCLDGEGSWLRVTSSRPPNLPTPRPPEKTTFRVSMMLGHTQYHVFKAASYSLGAGVPDTSNYRHTKNASITSLASACVRATNASPSLEQGQPLHQLSFRKEEQSEDEDAFRQITRPS